MSSKTDVWCCVQATFGTTSAVVSGGRTLSEKQLQIRAFRYDLSTGAVGFIVAVSRVSASWVAWLSS